MIKLTTPETDAVRAYEGNWDTKALRMTAHARKLERERDEAREAIRALAEHGESEIQRITKERDEAREELREWQTLRLWARIHESQDIEKTCEQLERELDEAREELSSIHRWIERNHADGFIDSLTYLQNLERVTDSWYDRIDAIESDARRFVKESDEARQDAERWESSSDAMERAAADQARRADENREWALKAERERDELKEALLIMENLLKPGIELFPEIGEILKQGAK